ncbi:helix-hairpin-helix domain-containing protein [Alkalicoccus urumqiensis]|uniref:Competence protein ComEA n=1 Tax=Alkalicoccus urumqiensis TaxID=1548213 RepID=A0A2P6MFL3_ALKUR|nr:helix-hairpin-helix domain-containing protein [Alkalicoccus urumqiensis]PRO65082.1 competence protein ComEA [Alkalicoccus urumqiensis]
MDRLVLFIKEKGYYLLIPAALLLLYVLFPAGEEDYASLDRPEADAAEENSEETGAEETAAGNAAVYIHGEVVSPGVYAAETGARVEDIIQLAGGLTAEADAGRINLAQRIQDEMQITVPAAGESESGSEEGEEADDGVVIINQADEAAWESLPGIGPSKASAIVQYREENGPFSSVDALVDVPGIGEKTLEQLRPSLRHP